MRKFLCLMTLLAAVLTLCLALSACGGDEAITTTTAAALETTPAPVETTAAIVTTADTTTPSTDPLVTTAAVTAPVTTTAVTTTTPSVVPETPANVGISYSYFFSGFMVAELDENGLTLKRELHKPATMQCPVASHLGFYYEYDENGKLIGYTAEIYDEKIVGTVSWDTDEQTAIVTDAESGEVIREILFEKNGMMYSEKWFSDGVEVFYFEYDETGRMMIEMIPGEMELVVNTTYENNEATVLFEVMYNKVAHWLITYNEAGYPTTLENKIDGAETYYSYEYDEYNRCVSSVALVDGEEGFYYFSYDKAGKLATVEFEDGHGLTKTEYEYNSDGVLIKETVSQYDSTGNLIDREVTDHTA